MAGVAIGALIVGVAVVVGAFWIAQKKKAGLIGVGLGRTPSSFDNPIMSYGNLTKEAAENKAKS